MTYLGLDAIALAVTAAVVVAAVRPGWTGRRWWLATALTAAVLMILTAVFDTVMIAADLFRYDHSALIGLRIGLTPVEDLAWPLVAAVLLPALWELLGRARRPGRTRPAVHHSADAPARSAEIP